MESSKIIKYEPKLYVPPGYEEELNKDRRPLSKINNLPSTAEITSRLQMEKAKAGDIIESSDGTEYNVTEHGWTRVHSKPIPKRERRRAQRLARK